MIILGRVGMTEPSHLEIIEQVNKNHLVVIERLSTIETRLDYKRQRINDLDERIEANGENTIEIHNEVLELKTSIKTGVVAVRIVAWIGGAILALWGAWITWFKGV
jgi:hypothetical protein